MSSKPHIVSRLHGKTARWARLGPGPCPQDGHQPSQTPRAAWWTNTLATCRHGEYPRQEITAAPGDDNAGVGCRAFADGGVDALVEPPAGRARAWREAGRTEEKVSKVRTDRFPL